MLAAADAAAQLVQLRQAEPLGVLDHHQRRVRHVDADLDDRRRDQDAAAVPAANWCMTASFSSPFIRPCSSATANSGNTLRDLLRHRGRGLEIDLLRLLDERIDHVDLAAAADLVAHHRVDLVAPRVGLDRAS